MNPEAETIEATEAIEPAPVRNFVIPNACVTIRSKDEPVDIEELLSVVFSIAASNPGCKVYYHLEIDS